MADQQLFSRTDTSICPHLSNLIDLPASSAAGDKATVAYEGIPGPLGDTKRAAVERKFTEAINWGAISQGVKRRKTIPPTCSTCGSTIARPWVCLTCAFVGCMSFTGRGTDSKDCIKSHLASSEGSCAFAVEPLTGSIFCLFCDDTTYPDSFETLFLTARIRIEESHDRSREPGMVGGKGRGRGEWKAWNPSNMVGVNEGEVTRTSCRGLRPLLNLSQTCFLSAILQALIHNPLLKAYFLSDKHNRYVCTNSGKEKGCVCCELDKAFEEFYNEDKSPFGPVTMLWAMWHTSTELEGYGQQDAHSFFLAALDQIHAHAKGQLSSCSCIAHQTFAGSLQSSVICSKCSKTSTTVDPILDIQLDFPPSATTSVSPEATILNNDNQLTLAGMLRKFCAAERVGEPGGKGYDCSGCGGGLGVVAMRKLGIKKLAPVLSFQLKASITLTYDSSLDNIGIESHVRFPSTLDMRPYCSSSTTSTYSDRQNQLPDSLYLYDLFAVVTHEGKLDNGHYWADVRDGEEWWHCDDDKVTPTTLSTVLSQKAYMLFYVKRSLAYAQPMSRLLAGGSSTSLSANGV
nr:ubiquitin carboxyl-terminal hydrolase 22/27/51 [Cryptococcus depauperatus CBS 7841]